MMYYYPFFGFGWVFMIVFWSLIIWAIVSLLKPRHYHDKSDHVHGRHHALVILQERYAKGEISKEQYKEMKRDLAE